jgi:glutamyl-tRNA synthetase
MQYKDMGILPAALLNYLARLCWGHGDDEIFSLEKFIEWFDLVNVSGSPARFDMKKLYWVNGEHIKRSISAELALLVKPLLEKRGVVVGLETSTPLLEDVIELVKARADNLNTLVDECEYFYQVISASEEDVVKILTPEALEIIRKFADSINNLNEWSLDAIKLMIKEFCALENIKMPQIGMPLRLKLCGTTHTPSFDAVVYLLGRHEVIRRLTLGE